MTSRLGSNYFPVVFRAYCRIACLSLVGHEGDDGAPKLITFRTSSNEYLFPALQELILTVNYVASRAWWSNLRDSLIERQAAGCPLKCLVIRGRRACHAYWPGTGAEQGTAYKRVTNGLAGSEAIARWLQDSEVRLEREQELVEEFLDERVLDGCECARRVEKRTSPWYMPYYMMNEPSGRKRKARGKAG